MPVSKLVVFGLVGGWLYLAYWMYGNWKAYRTEWGYSRKDFWQKVNDTTGYRVSPFWRAALQTTYCFCLFPAVHRECRQNGVRGVPRPVLLATLYGFVLPLLSVSGDGLASRALSPVWALVPIQLGINRLNEMEDVKPRLGVRGIELVFVVLGALLTWR